MVDCRICSPPSSSASPDIQSFDSLRTSKSGIHILLYVLGQVDRQMSYCFHMTLEAVIILLFASITVSINVRNLRHDEVDMNVFRICMHSIDNLKFRCVMLNYFSPYSKACSGVTHSASSKDKIERRARFPLSFSKATAFCLISSAAV